MSAVTTSTAPTYTTFLPDTACSTPAAVECTADRRMAAQASAAAARQARRTTPSASVTEMLRRVWPASVPDGKGAEAFGLVMQVCAGRLFGHTVPLQVKSH